jgi:hypothetical protein
MAASQFNNRATLTSNGQIVVGGTQEFQPVGVGPEVE